ncbi:MAG: hypothetical protein J6Y49_01640 [Alphaproteobacteria bacterium]|nr:hypothetical protein [Alphaproteobacteria bacterium]
MKKTLIAVACAAFISTGAMAKPASHQPPKSHNNNHSVQMVNKAPKSAPHISNHGAPAHHSSHHGGGVHVAHVYTAPPPPAHHHHHHHSSHLDFGDALIAFAILATAF